AALTPQIIAGTENALTPFWSPDSRVIAFVADGKLKRIDIASKSLQTICNLPETRGDTTGSWGSAGTIVFTQDWTAKIYRVPATGGTPSLILQGKSDYARRWVRFLPDGNRFIFYKYDEGAEKTGEIYSGSIDSAEIKHVLSTPPAYAQYVNGYLLYPREGSLMAQQFDVKKLSPTGEPAVVIDNLPYFDKSGWCEFSASDTGVLAYMTADPKKRLVWFDRTGREMGQIGEPEVMYQVRLAPDGQRALLAIADRRTRSSGGDIWIQDLTRSTRTPFVTGPNDDGEPVWSPDGKREAYFSCCEDVSSLHIKDINDTGKGELPIKNQFFVPPVDWSQDGRFILYRNSGDFWVLPLTGDVKPYLLVKTQTSAAQGVFSPDGHWVAFVSNETGGDEIYVTSFEHPGEKWRVSNGGGGNP